MSSADVATRMAAQDIIAPANPAQLHSLDESLYSIDSDGEAFEFMKAQTGIQDPDELRNHILAVQADAYSVRFLNTIFILSSH